ncbi:MAG: cysteine desulfurase NifS [Coriobacteriaceae bacterium]|nr:cysteine desulfurase NifS [Coriobacteriaceae bacterium]
MKTIYLDNAATTPCRPEVVEAMLPYFTEKFGNPSAIYNLGQVAQDAIQQARKDVAGVINAASPNEVFFTSGGSEADNWALKGVMDAYKDKKGKHLITTKIEHHAILHTAQFLEQQGFEVTYLDVDEYGLVSPEAFEAAIRPDTVMASIMFANNEIGTIEPIKELAAIAHAHKVIFHTDAVQAFCHEKIDVQELGIDLMSASGHKLYGPKGVGMLYVRRGVRISNLIHGGGQERGKRATTENTAGIVGFAKAAVLAEAEREEQHERQAAIRDHAIQRITTEIPHCFLNGHPTQRLANNINISFEFIEGEGMLLRLGAKGICASSGSACTSGSLDPSHVLLAIGLPHEKAHGSLRATLGRDTTLEDVDFMCDVLKDAIAGLREMSPLWEDFQAQGK